MPEIQTDSPRLSAPPDAQEAPYRAVCGLAVAALLVGLISPLALFGPLVWFIPLAGIALAAAALRRIAEDPSVLIGRKAALVGLVLSLVVGLAAPIDWTLFRRHVRKEGRQFAQYWFDYLRNRQPERAFQLTMDPSRRQPLDDTVWQAYADGSETRKMLEMYVEKPVNRALLALGDKAEVRYYDTERQTSDEGRDAVTQTFAVTSDLADGPTTFFVAVSMERSYPTGAQKAYWKVVNVEGGVRPKVKGGSGERPGE